ncbi:MAG TPA: SPOR domain-containing protein [Fluviicola sp.]|nr:SPOR domain-containing protein [Fluviicola sp.]
MNNYLLQLLKEVKTIIIPGLGAITLTNEATGEMMFMPYLKYDDGNLANHIANKEGWELNDAKNLIAKFVREVMAELDKGNSYDMYQFGSFKKVDGEVDFVQWTGGATAPEQAAEPAPEPAVEATPEPVTEIIPEPVEEPEPVVEATPEPAAEPEPIVEKAPEPVIETSVDPPFTPDTPVEEPKEEPKEEPVKEEKTDIPVAETVAAAAIVVDAIPEPIPEPPVEAPKPEPVAEKPAEAKPEPVKEEPKKPIASKEKLAAEAKKKEADKKKAEKAAQPKKRRAFGYILWGFVVLLMGGATYVALNFDTLKKDFPILADLAGENEKPNGGSTEDDKPAIAEGEKDANPDNDSIYEEPATENEIESTPAPEEIPAPEPEPVKEKPAPAPKPVEKTKPAPKPKPVAKPKPAPKPVNTTPKKPKPRPNNNSNVAIGSPDPSRPYHVIGGSFGSEANAKRLARQLIAKGQPSVIVGEFNGMYRVSIASFATEAEANQASNDLKSIVPAAWVFKWP